MNQPSTPGAPSPPAQPRNPLHGLTLETIVSALVARYGWADIGVRIPVRCFTHDPSIASSLKFLRKTPWAREKVEGLYLFMLREERRQSGGRLGTTHPVPLRASKDTSQAQANPSKSTANPTLLANK